MGQIQKNKSLQSSLFLGSLNKFLYNYFCWFCPLEVSLIFWHIFDYHYLTTSLFFNFSAVFCKFGTSLRQKYGKIIKTQKSCYSEPANRIQISEVKIKIFSFKWYMIFQQNILWRIVSYINSYKCAKFYAWRTFVAFL